MEYTLRQWQNIIKNEQNLIINASHINEQDELVPWPIGFSFKYLEARETLSLSDLQIGNHNELVLSAFLLDTDIRRRAEYTINRKKIDHTLNQKGIQNLNLDYLTYFKSLPNYKFIISPEGNGIDCHRHYEALLAGCIPIIEDNNIIKQKYRENIPIIYNKDYNDIDLTEL